MFEYYISKLLKKLHLRCIKNSKIDKTSAVGAESNIVDSTIGKHSFCGYNCIVLSTDIGMFCSIGSNCEIGGANHTVDWVSTSPVFNINKDQINKKYSKHNFNPIEKRVKIGNDVWLGSKVIIKSGVKIGNGAIVGAGSVVTKNIPDYEIWAGNPAKFIRKRFDDQIIEKLLYVKWWNFDEEKLLKLSKNSNDVQKFLKDVDNLERKQK